MVPYSLIESIIGGILLGGILAISALGLNMIFGVTKIINFAHGEALMIGAYVTYWFFELYSFEPVFTSIFTFPILAILGFVIYELTIRPLVGKPSLSALLGTYGLSIFLVNFVRLIWSPRWKGVKTSLPNVDVFGLNFSAARLATCLIGLLGACLLYIFLKKTLLGRAIRATAQDADTATLMGVNANYTYAITFMMGTALAGIGGSLISITYTITPEMGTLFNLMSFCIVILGGLGSFTGTIIAAFTVGIIATVGATIFGMTFQSFIFFTVLTLSLLIRPRWSARAGTFKAKFKEILGLKTRRRSE